MKLLVAAPDSFDDFEKLHKTLDHFVMIHPTIEILAVKKSVLGNEIFEWAVSREIAIQYLKSNIKAETLVELSTHSLLFWDGYDQYIADIYRLFRQKRKPFRIERYVDFTKSGRF